MCVNSKTAVYCMLDPISKKNNILMTVLLRFLLLKI